MQEEPKRRKKQSGGDEQSGKDGKSMSVLECFQQLSSWQRDVRLRAAKHLVTQLLQLQASSSGGGDKLCDDVTLSVERLVEGLSSGREGARQAYAVALTEMLGTLTAIPTESVVSRLEERPPHSEPREAEKQRLFGRAVGVACLVRSGRLQAEQSAEKRGLLLKRLANVLTTTRGQRSYLDEICGHGLLELVRCCSGDAEFRAWVLPSVKSMIEVSPEDLTPEGLAILLELEKRWGLGARTFNSEWGAGKLHEDVSGIRHALLRSSGSVPRVHHVWRALLDSVEQEGANDGGNNGAKREESALVKLWREAVDALLFVSHVDNRKYLAFALLCAFVRQCRSDSDIVAMLQCPNTGRTLVGQVRQGGKMLRVAQVALSLLIARAKQRPGLAAILLQTRVPVLTQLQLDRKLLPLLDWHGGSPLVTSLIAKQPFQKDGVEVAISIFKRCWKRWCHAPEGQGPTADEGNKLATEFVQLLLKQAAGGDAKLRKWARSRLATVLAELELTGHADTVTYSQWAIAEFSQTETPESRRHVFDVITNGLADAKKMLTGKAAAGANDRFFQAFTRVLGLIAFRLLLGDGGAEEDGDAEETDARKNGANGEDGDQQPKAMDEGEDDDEEDEDEAAATSGTLAEFEDALLAAKKFSDAMKGGKVAERNKAVLVLVSILVELLTAPSAFVRAAVMNSFRLVAPMIPRQGVMEIVSAVVAQESALIMDDADADGDEEEPEEEPEKGKNNNEEEALMMEAAAKAFAKGVADQKKNKNEANGKDDGDDEDDEDEDEEDDAGAGAEGNDDEAEGAQKDELEQDEEAKFGELEQICVDDMDPEHLRMIDDELSKMFQALRKSEAGKGSSKQEKKELERRKGEARDFKHRVVDLLEAFGRSVPRMAKMETLPFSSLREGDNRSVIFEALPRLLTKLKKLQFLPKLRVLYDKLRKIVLSVICDVKEWPVMTGHQKPLIHALDGVISLAARGNPTADFTNLLVHASVMLSKILHRDQLLSDEATAERFMRVAAYAGTRKNMKFMTIESFFGPLFLRQSHLTMRLSARLLRLAADNKWQQRARAQSLTVLATHFAKGAGRVALHRDGSAAEPTAKAAVSLLRIWLTQEAQKGQIKKHRNSMLLIHSVLQSTAALIKVLTDPKLGSPAHPSHTVFRLFEDRDKTLAALDKFLDLWPALREKRKLEGPLRDLTLFLAGPDALKLDDDDDDDDDDDNGDDNEDGEKEGKD